MNEQAMWYVVHTFSGYENKVATDLMTIVENRRDLQDQIVDVKIPTETVEEIKNGQRVEVERKIFPGYVLVKMIMSDANWFVVRNIRGCTGFVGPNGTPVPLTEREILRLYNGCIAGMEKLLEHLSDEGRKTMSVDLTTLRGERAMRFDHLVDWDAYAFRS